VTTLVSDTVNVMMEWHVAKAREAEIRREAETEQRQETPAARRAPKDGRRV